MAIETLLKSLQSFLRCERALNESDAGPAARAVLRVNRDEALDRLAAQVSSFEAAERAAKPFRHIVCAVDESRQAAWALDIAARLAEEVSARLTIVHVVDVAARLTPEMSLAGVTREALLGAGECFVQEAGMRLPRGTKAELIVRDGAPADEIVATAEACGADLVVMGTHGRGRLGTFLIGSTAEAVVQAAKCPVLTVAHEPAAAERARQRTQEGAGAPVEAAEPAKAARSAALAEV